MLLKVISKVLVSRIRPFLEEFIGPLQSSFIPKRWTTANALIAHEIVHQMHKKKGKRGFLLFKIDFEKAYDRVDWGFLELTLTKFGFPPLIIGLIMSCITSSSLSLKWNGEKLDSFTPIRGLRQGDLLSPYLFVLCMEKLAILIQEKVQQKKWLPIKFLIMVLPFLIYSSPMIVSFLNMLRHLRLILFEMFFRSSVKLRVSRLIFINLVLCLLKMLPILRLQRWLLLLTSSIQLTWANILGSLCGQEE